MILFPSSALPTLSPSAFLVSNPEKDSFICEKDLTRNQKTHLARYRAKFEGSKFFSLSQNPLERSEEKQRMVTARESLLTLGFPCAPSCAAAKVDPVDIDNIPQKKLLDYAGNGMHLPCVGFALLVAVLALQPVSNSK